MISALEELTGPGKSLKSEPRDADEFNGLVESANVRLRDAQNTKLALESRFDLAYNAAHALCLAALRWQAIGRANATSSSNYCLTRWGSDRKCGASFRNAMSCEIWANTRTRSASTSES